VECGGEVDGDDRVPAIDREFLDLGHELDACVVDQDVHAAEVLLGIAHHVFDLGGLAHVGAVVAHPRRCRPARFPPLRRHVTESVDNDVRALRGQGLRDAESDAAGRAVTSAVLPLSMDKPPSGVSGCAVALYSLGVQSALADACNAAAGFSEVHSDCARRRDAAAIESPDVFQSAPRLRTVHQPAGLHRMAYRMVRRIRACCVCTA
jgi:hypothetical protein